MYCVIGEKILKCEVSEKLENYSWVRIGKTEKGQTIPNNRIFETEDAAQRFIQKRNTRKSAIDKDILDEVAACKSAYDAFFKETGISVRIIDRLFRIGDVEKQLAHLRKKYNKSEYAKENGAKITKDSRQFSTKPSSSFKSSKEVDKGKTHKPSNKQNAKSSAKSGTSPGNKQSNRQASKSNTRTYR